MSKDVAVVVSGGLGAGKTTAARYLASYWELEHLSFVERIWMPILRARSIEPSRSVLQELGIELVNEVGIEGLVDRLLSMRETQRIVIDDARRPDVVRCIRHRLRRVVHVHLEADFDTRFPRLAKRDDVRSRADQEKAEQISTETTISQMRPIADHVVENTGSLARLQERLDQIMESVD